MQDLQKILAEPNLCDVQKEQELANQIAGAMAKLEAGERPTLQERADMARDIAGLRKSLGITQQELAKAAGVSLRTVGYLEEGKAPQRDNLIKLLSGVIRLRTHQLRAKEQAGAGLQELRESLRFSPDGPAATTHLSPDQLFESVITPMFQALSSETKAELFVPLFQLLKQGMERDQTRVRGELPEEQ